MPLGRGKIQSILTSMSTGHCFPVGHGHGRIYPRSKSERLGLIVRFWHFPAQQLSFILTRPTPPLSLCLCACAGFSHITRAQRMPRCSRNCHALPQALLRSNGFASGGHLVCQPRSLACGRVIVFQLITATAIFLHIKSGVGN